MRIVDKGHHSHLNPERNIHFAGIDVGELVLGLLHIVSHLGRLFADSAKLALAAHLAGIYKWKGH